MTNKTVSTKTTSAIFLAIVLVTGTITAISPSLFMTSANAQAQPPYYEDNRYDPEYPSKYTNNNSYKSEYPSYQDNSYYNSKDSSVILKKINCNNINSNNNWVDVNLVVPNGNDTIAEAQGTDEGQATTANGWGYGEGYKQNENDFKFVCINNNDNENNVIVINETIPVPPDTITCEECFSANSTLQTAIEDFLVAFEGRFIFTEFGEALAVAPNTDTIEQLCFQIENSAKIFGVPLSDEFLKDILLEILGQAFESGIDTLIECLLEAGIIVEREFPDSISANGIYGVNVECTGDSLCARLQ